MRGEPAFSQVSRFHNHSQRTYWSGTCVIACGKPAGMAESAPMGADRMDSRTCGAPDSPVPTSQWCSDQPWGVLVIRSDGSVVRAGCGARRRLVARGVPFASDGDATPSERLGPWRGDHLET